MRVQYNLFKTLSVIVMAGFIAGCSSMGSMMVQDNAKAKGWVVPKVYDFQTSMKKYKQPDPGRVKVVKLCQPVYAGKMLAHDDSKFVAAMMPCSIGIYEKSDGKVYVSSMNIGLMSKMFGGVVDDTLALVAADDAEILEFLNEQRRSTNRL